MTDDANIEAAKEKFEKMLEEAEKEMNDKEDGETTWTGALQAAATNH